MRVALAADLDEPLGVARGRDGGVLEQEELARGRRLGASSGAMPIVQPAAPGGGPLTTMSPEPATRARAIPLRLRTAIASLARRSPWRSRRGRASCRASEAGRSGPRRSSRIWSEPTRARALASSSGSGSFGRGGPVARAGRPGRPSRRRRRRDRSYIACERVEDVEEVGADRDGRARRPGRRAASARCRAGNR